MESAIAFPKFAFSLLDSAEESYKIHKKFSDEILENLHDVFGNVFVQACELVESYNLRVTKFKTEDQTRCIYKISNHKEQYTIYEDLNFCFCPTFKTDVLDKRDCLTCKHVLAVKICRITGNVVEEIITGLQFAGFLNEHLNFVEDYNSD